MDTAHPVNASAATDAMAKAGLRRVMVVTFPTPTGFETPPDSVGVPWCTATMPKTPLRVGDDITARRLDTITGATVSVPDSERLVHLQFRRFAGCPICHLQLRSLSRRHDEIVAAGVSEVAVFHSSADTLREYQSDLPFAVVADPEKTLYRQFGVETSLASVLHPRAWLAAARGVAQQRSLRPGMGPGEEHLSRPADFLISPQGVLLAAKYGAHADDQWSVDEIIGLAARFGAGS